MQGKDEPRVQKQGFKVWNTPVKIDKMKVNTFLWFLIFFLFFLLWFVATTTVFNSNFHYVDIVFVKQENRCNNNHV
jgi:hypothetical protein